MPEHPFDIHPRRPGPGLFRIAPAMVLAILPSCLAASPLEDGRPGGSAKGLSELKAFFAQNCVKCHGTDGSATDPDGTRRPGMDFTKAAVTYREMNGPASQREIRTMIRTIRKGIFFGRVMPSWREFLSEEEAALMVKEILLKAEKGKTIEPDP
jgi:mono/diheme cytochrome c family protein